MIKTILILSIASYLMFVFIIYKCKPTTAVMFGIKNDTFYLLITALFPLFCLGIAFLFIAFWFSLVCFIAMFIIVKFTKQTEQPSYPVSVNALPKS